MRIHKAGLAVLVIVLAAYAWKKNKLNKILPGKLQHHEGFIGLDRSGQYVTAPGGGPGRPGTDVNTSVWV